ncbi:MAG: 3-hydroxyacyl-CoA dehydrogenase NAD-binding domain-containing protein, partial [Trueperaceae bacterium]
MDRPDDATTPTGSPTGSPPASVPVTVVGAGTMGSGIARACLEAGHPVRLHDAFEAAVDRAAERIDAGLRRAATKAGADAGDPDETLANLRTSHGAGDDALADVARDAAVVFEAGAGDAGRKRAAWAALGEGAPAGALLGSNTSSLSITELGAASGRAADLCGLHFFHPVARLPLVELVRGERTTDEVLDRAEAFVLGLGKTP